MRDSKNRYSVTPLAHNLKISRRGRGPGCNGKALHPKMEPLHGARSGSLTGLPLQNVDRLNAREASATARRERVDIVGHRFASSKALFTTSSLGLFKYGSMAWKESHPPTDITTRGFI